MRRSFAPLIVTLLFASALWIGVNMAADVQTSMRIPLVVDLPEGRAASSSLPRELTATVRGPGWKIVQFTLLSKPVCRVDLSDASARHADATISHRTLLQAIALPPQLVLSDIEPDSITIALDAFRERTVAVVPAMHLACRRGFEQTEPAHADPDSIVIAGARSVVNPIVAWSTRPVTVLGAVQPVRAEVALSDSLSDLVRVPQQRIVVTADVQEIGERTFTNVPIHVVNAPAGARIHLQPATATVLVRGGAETLGAMNPGDVQAAVDYFALLEVPADRAPVTVAGPPHTTVLRHEPRTVEWFIRTQQ